MTHKNSNPFSNDDVIKDENKEENNVETSETEAKTEEETKDTSDKKDESKNEEYSKLKADYDKLNQQYVRLAADFDNFRKRQEQERENLIKYGTEAALKKMIEVLDNFERGLKAIETVEDCEKVKECYNLAYKNFKDVLTKAGLEAIKAEGETFDPNFHEAVMQTPSTEHPEHTIIAELQKGYKLGDKVLRPTLVNVATEG